MRSRGSRDRPAVTGRRAGGEPGPEVVLLRPPAKSHGHTGHDGDGSDARRQGTRVLALPPADRRRRRRGGEVSGDPQQRQPVHPFNETEQHDMYDLVEWMAAQPWSNGDVGVNGHSYGAILGYLGAAQRPPHLRTVVAGASYANLYEEMVYLGGIRNLDVQGWQHGLVSNTLIFPTWRAHPLYDAYWKERVIDNKYEALRADRLPILAFSS